MRHVFLSSSMTHISQFTQMSAHISHYQAGSPSMSSNVYIDLPFTVLYLFLKYKTRGVCLFVIYYLFITSQPHKNVNIQRRIHTNKYYIQISIRHFVDLALGVHK